MKRLVFDWNGTLYDDAWLGLQCINRLLDKYNLRPLETLDEYREIFDFPVIDYYRKLGFDFEKLDWDEIANEFMSDYLSHVPQIGLFEEVQSVLEEARKRNMGSVILSASEINNLKDQIAPFGLDELVDGIYGIENIYASSKEHLAEELKKKYPEDELIFIGDTLHDAHVADAVGARCILVDQGHQSRQRLLQAGVPVVSNLKEALESIDD